MVDYTQGSVSREIDGYTYTSTKLPALRAVALLGRCCTALGDRGMRAVVQRHAHGFAEVAPVLVLAAQEINLYGAMLQGSYGVQQDPELPRDLLEAVKVDKLRPANIAGGSLTGANFDQHFAGELPHMFCVLEFVALHNYLGFTLGRRFPFGSVMSAEIETGAPSDSHGPLLE
jgi:hypothetical protein